MSVLGAVIAGGRSTRYGAPKALAVVGGVRIIDRVLATLGEVVPARVAIINDPALAEAVDVPSRADAVPGGGALAGIHAAVSWAAERGDDAVLAVGCDMPFLTPALLRALLGPLQAGMPRPDIVIPESGGPRGVEPLCAVYSVSCLPGIERAFERGDRRVIGFHDDVRVRRLAAAEVAKHGAADLLFFNVNTPADRKRAERMYAQSRSTAGRSGE